MLPVYYYVLLHVTQKMKLQSTKKNRYDLQILSDVLPADEP